MEQRKRTSQRPRKKPLRYFYLDGELTPGGPLVPLLHKKLHINRGEDIITAWCYPTEQRVAYTYSDVKRRAKPAFSTPEVCKMVNRKWRAVNRALKSGNIKVPQHTYGLDEEKNLYKYMWSEEDVLDLHAYLKTLHYGRPRNDGLATPRPLPTERELKAMMRNQEVLYVKVGDKFYPTWEADQI